MTQWSAILEAITTTLSGDRGAGRAAMEEAWSGLGPDDHAQRCVLAHYLADVQEDLDAEVRWDERALEAYAGVAPDALAAVGIPAADGLAPSLHLNLADGYLRQCLVEDATRHVEAGLAAAPVLADDGYGAMVRAGLERCRDACRMRAR